MKKGISFQIIFILLLLIFWNFIQVGYDYFQKDIYQKLSAKPVILISNEDAALDNLVSEIDTLAFYDFSVVKSDSLVLQNLIKNYGFSGIKEMIGHISLPSIVKIYINPQYFKHREKEFFENKVTDEYESIIMNYDVKTWQQAQAKLRLLDIGFLAVNGLIIIAMIFFMIFLRLHYEHKSNDYWRVYCRSGGSLKYRRKNFWINSLLLFFIPAIIAALLYFAAYYFQFITFMLPYWMIAAELSILLLSILLSRIFLRGDI